MPSTPEASTTSVRPGRRFRTGALAAVLISCAGVATIPGQQVTGAKLSREWSAADTVFVGIAVDYSPDSPPIEPHDDYFTPITYRVLEPLKGGGAAGSQLVVYHRARWPSPTVDDRLRLRSEVFGRERPLVVFAHRDGDRLRSRDREMEQRPGTDPGPLGVVAATADVLARLRGFRDKR